MGTYHNAYQILGDVREGLNEFSTALQQGTDTYGKYSNSYIMLKINRAQRMLYAKLFKRIEEHFLTSVDLVGVDSVYTLPWYFGKIRRFEDENDIKVLPVSIDHRPTVNGRGSDSLYYHKGNTLVLTRSGVTKTYTLWYYKKPRELDQGAATATDTLASTAKEIADYYNGMTIEQVETTTDQGEITDYTAARVITSGITLASTKYYGIVSDLPEMFHQLIAPLGVMLCKAEHPVSPEKPTKSEIGFWNDELEDAIVAFAGNKGDVPPEDIWTDFGGGRGGGGVNIPGQGYLI